MGNYLKMADKQRVLALLELGWSYRRIERETGIRRETVARYDPRRAPKAATPTAGELSKPAKVTAGSVSACQPYRTIIEAAIARGLTAQRIWQDLREEYGFGYSYSSVKRFVRGLKRSHPEVADVLEQPPGQRPRWTSSKGRPPLTRGAAGGDAPGYCGWSYPAPATATKSPCGGRTRSLSSAPMRMPSWTLAESLAPCASTT